MSDNNETEILCDGISVSVTEHLGNRYPHFRQAPLRALNAFISYWKERKIRAADLRAEGPLYLPALVMIPVAENQKATALEFWKSLGGKDTGQPLLMVTTEIGPVCYVPAAFLSHLTELVDGLQAQQKQAEPPWLFREKPMADYPCQLQDDGALEKPMLQGLERQLAAAEAEPVFMLRYKLLQDLEQGTLREFGITSPLHGNAKRHYLDLWNCKALLRAYRRYNREAQLPDVVSLRRLDEKLKKLVGQTSLTTAESTVLRRFVWEEADMLQLFSPVNAAAIRKILNEHGLAVLAPFYDAVQKLLEYYQSAIRTACFGECAIDVFSLPFAADWFIDHPDCSFAQMLKLEQAISGTAFDRVQMLVMKIDGRNTAIRLNSPDGVHIMIDHFEELASKDPFADR